jgi:hypothetical protein
LLIPINALASISILVLHPRYVAIVLPYIAVIKIHEIDK